MQRLLVAEGVSLGRDGEALVVADELGERRIPLTSEVVRRIVRLADRPCTVDELAQGLLTAHDGLRQLALLSSTARDLLALGFIDQIAELEGVVVARLVRKGNLPLRGGDPPEDAVVSRHAVATRAGRWVVLDSGIGCGLVRVDPSVAGHVLSGEGVGPGERLSVLRELLWRAGLLVPVSSEESLEQMMWDPVDLLMVERANDSSADRRYGGTYRYHGVFPAPPLVEPIRADELVELPDPDPAGWFREDEPFGAISERRRSVSSFRQDIAPTLRQVANVLHRSARVQYRFHDDKGVEVSRRPAAGGGALHELDLYLAVDRVDGLDQGLWRYNPVDNVLERVHCSSDPSALIDEATKAVWSRTRPPVTIIMVARFARVLWKYEGVGAALVLKDVGVLMHALHLSAVAEGLGACALGNDSAHVFERVTGLGFPSHGPVGQLVIGVGKGGEQR